MKKLTVLMFAFIVALGLSACDSGEETIKIGVFGPLSGEYSHYGVAVERGAKLAADEINAAGGLFDKDFEIIAYDTQGLPAEGVNVYNRLITQDEVSAIVGGTFSGETLAIKDLAIAEGIPILSPTATHPDVTVDAPNVFRACYTDSYQGAVAAQFAIEQLEATNAAVFYNVDDAYSEGLALAFIDAYEAAELTVESYSFTNGTDDYNATLTQIQAGAYDVVFVPAYVAEVGAILTQAAQLNFGDTPFLGGDGWDGIEGDYADVAEGHYFVNHYAKTDPAQNVQDFVANFTAEYDTAPNALAALGYDAVYALYEAFKAADSTEYADVVAALQALTYADAVTGAISFDANGDPIKAITVIQVVEGEHVVIDKIQGE